MVAATNPPQENPSRKPPLLVNSDKESKKESNGVINQRKPRSKMVSSRYMSPSPSTSATSTSNSTSGGSCFSSSSNSSASRRFASPLNVRSNGSNIGSSCNSLTPGGGPKRSQSVDRGRSVSGRPMTPVRPTLVSTESRLGNTGEVMSGGVSAAAKMLVTSTRSLSVSFQGEAFSLPVSKAKTPSLSSSRKGTPERRKVANTVRGKIEGGGGGDQAGSPWPSDQHRWPARTREINSLSKSIDCSVSERRLDGSGLAVKGLEQSMADVSPGSLIGGRLSLDFGSARHSDAILANDFSVASDLTASDTDSVSSGSTSGVQDLGSKVGVCGRSAPRGIAVSARFWQETNSRLRRLQDPGSPLSMSPGSRMLGPPKFIQSKRFPSDSSPMSTRTIPSPTKGASRPASPSKFLTPLASSPMRGSPSPSRVRSSVSINASGDFSNGPSFFSYSVDLRRKVGDNRIVDAQLLRLLYNRYLQWRFVNARADAVCSVQKRTTEKNLWNGWIAISELRRSVTVKRSKLQLLRQKLKLASVLRAQMPYMEEWALLDGEHSNSLLGATKALKESTLRVPVVGRAIADIQKIKDAVGSAVDAMNIMASSIWSRLSKMEEINSLMSELVSVTRRERALLNQCKDFLSMLAAMQVEDSSMRTHTLQISRELTKSSLTTRVQN